MKVFVSGAAGFIGSAVTADLVKRGHKVLGMAIDNNEAKIVKEAGGKPVIGDLRMGGEWCDIIGEADKVISLTQPMKMGDVVTRDNIESYGRKHTEAVTNLIKAAADGKARQVIVTNHTECFGDRKGRWVESDAAAHDPVGFCRPLSGSFEAIERTAEDAGLSLVNLYPAPVYGNGGWFPMVVDEIRNGTMKTVEPGNNFLNLIHVDDLATMYSLVVEKVEGSDVFILSDDRPVTQLDMIGHLAALLDVKMPEVVSFAEFEKLYGWLEAECVSCNTRVSSLKAFQTLGYAPKLRSYEQGFLYTLKQMGIEARRKAA